MGCHTYSNVMILEFDYTNRELMEFEYSIKTSRSPELDVLSPNIRSLKKHHVKASTSNLHDILLTETTNKAFIKSIRPTISPKQQ